MHKTHKPLISLIVPSRRLHQLNGFFDSVQKNTIDYKNVEILVKIDDDNQEFLEYLNREVSERPFVIKYLSTPRLGGQFTLWIAYEELLDMVNGETYFVAMLTDETRIDSYGWDDTLKKYVGFFKDDVFRLRVSQSRYVSNIDLLTCVYLPECFAIFTKKWLDIVEGFGDSYAPDTHHQMIAYHLGSGTSGITGTYHSGGIYRDIQVHDIKFSGFDWGQDVTKDQSMAHEIRMIWEWHRLMSYKTQKQFSYYSRKIMAYIWACDNSLENFKIVGGYSSVCVMDCDGKLIKVFSANLSFFKMLIKNYDAYIFLYKRKIIITIKYIFMSVNIDLYYVLKKINKIKKKYYNLLKLHYKKYFITRFLKNLYNKYNSFNINFKYDNHEKFLDSSPQGLDRGRFWFNWLYKRTGYVTPDPDMMMINYRHIRDIRKSRRELMWSRK